MTAKRKSKKKQKPQSGRTNGPEVESDRGGQQRLATQPGPAEGGADSEASGGFWRRHGRDLIPAAIIALLALFLFSWGSGSYALADPWEPKYPQTVREMIERGSFITPYYEDDVRWVKPILIYWTQMVTIAVWGNNEFAARLPSALAAVWGLLAIYFCLLRLRDRRTAILGAAILASTPQYYFMARQATPDMLLTASLISAMTCLALARFGGRRQRLYHLLFYASVGVGVLAKGPLAIAIAAGAILVYWAIDFGQTRFASLRTFAGDFWAMLKSYHVGWGALTVLAVAGVWYLPMYFEHGAEFVDKFILKQNIERIAHAAHTGLGAPASAYAKTIMHGMYPWFGLLPAGFLLVLGRRRIDDRARQGWFFMAWLIAGLALMTMANTKVDHYVLPVTAPLAVIVALVWERYRAGDPPAWMPVAFLLAGLLVALVIKDFVTLSDVYIMDVFSSRKELVGVDVDKVLLVFLGAWIVIVVAAAVRERIRLLAPVAAVLAVCLAGYFSLYVLPKQENTRSVKAYVEMYQARKRPDSLLVMVGERRPSLVYYTGGRKTFQQFYEKEFPMLAELLRDAPSVFIVADRKLANESLAKLLLATGKNWTLLSDENPNALFFTNL